MREMHCRSDIQIYQVQLRIKRRLPECALQSNARIDCDRIQSAARGLYIAVKRLDALIARKVDADALDLRAMRTEPSLRIQNTLVFSYNQMSNPCWANWLASSYPIPLEAPVITANFSVVCAIVVSP